MNKPETEQSDVNSLKSSTQETVLESEGIPKSYTPPKDTDVLDRGSI